MALYKIQGMSVCFSNAPKRILMLKYISVLYVLEGDRRMILNYIHNDEALKEISMFPNYAELFCDTYTTLKPGKSSTVKGPVKFYLRKWMVILLLRCFRMREFCSTYPFFERKWEVSCIVARYATALAKPINSTSEQGMT